MILRFITRYLISINMLRYSLHLIYICAYVCAVHALTCIIHRVPLRELQMAVHKRKRSDDDAGCSKSYFQRERASTALRCSQLEVAVGIL